MPVYTGRELAMAGMPTIELSSVQGEPDLDQSRTTSAIRALTSKYILFNPSVDLIKWNVFYNKISNRSKAEQVSCRY